MRLALLLLLMGGCGASSMPLEREARSPSAKSVPPVEPVAARAWRLASQTILIDGHIDLPYRLHRIANEGGPMPDLAIAGQEGNFDAPRAFAGGLNAPFMSIYIPSKFQELGGAKKLADQLIDSVESITRKWPKRFALASSPSAVERNFRAGKISLLMGIENGAAIERDLTNLKHFYERGVRYITLTHAKDNLICDSSYDDQHTWKSLSPYGAQVVLEMNRLGIMVDISHVDDRTFYDVMKVTLKPVIASHSSLRHFTPGFERNMSDDMVRALAENGGVVMINFGSTFLSQEAIEWRAKYKAEEKRYKAVIPKGNEAADTQAHMDTWRASNPLPFATIEDVANHIDRVVQLVGIDYVGLGSDFDGVGDSLPIGLKDASGYPRLFEVLLLRGFSDQDIAKISSGNLLRVWRAQNNTR